MIGVLVVITLIIASIFITQPASTSKFSGRKIPCVYDYYNYCTLSYFGHARFESPFPFRDVPFVSPFVSPFPNHYGTNPYFAQHRFRDDLFELPFP